MSWDRFTSKITSLEIESWIGPAFYIRSFCDDPLGGIYVSKPPVCKLSMEPKTQFINTNIVWDISESSSATGTLDTFTVNWDGTTDIGNISGDSFGVDPESGNVQFTTVGVYTVTAYVVDTLGAKSKEQEIEIEIVENDYAYIGTTDAGLFLIDVNGDNSQSNSGLTGNHVSFRSLRLNPWFANLASGKRHLWACTGDGLAYSIDGGATWSVISKATLGDPVNIAGDSPSPVTADLDQIDIAFSPANVNVLYVLRTTATRLWVYASDDYGATWISYQPSAGTAVDVGDFTAFDANTVFDIGTTDGTACTGTELVGAWLPPGANLGTVAGHTIQFYYPSPIEWSTVLGYVFIPSNGSPQTVPVEIQLWRGDAGPWEEEFDTINYSVTSGVGCEEFTSSVASGGSKYFGIKVVISPPTHNGPYPIVYRVLFPGSGELTHSADGIPGAII